MRHLLLAVAIFTLVALFVFLAAWAIFPDCEIGVSTLPKRVPFCGAIHRTA